MRLLFCRLLVIISIVLLCGWIKTPRLAHGGASGEVFVDVITDEGGRIEGVRGRTTLFSDSTSWWDTRQWVGYYGQLEGLVDGGFRKKILSYRYLRGGNSRDDLGVEKTFSWFPSGLSEGYHVVSYRVKDIYSGEGKPSGGYEREEGNIIAEYRVRVFVDVEGNTYLRRVEEANLGLRKEQCPAMKGDPVNVATGNSFQRETDVRISAGLRRLELTRYYNSRSDYDGALGRGWTHSYDVRVWEGGEFYLHLRQANGAEMVFVKDPDNVYRENGPGGSWIEAMMQDDTVMGWHWFRSDGKEYEFDETGRLVKISYLGSEICLQYDEQGLLDTVEESISGRQLSFSYDEQDRIISIHGPTTNAIADGVWVRYAYDELGRLVGVTYADGSGWMYEYEDPNDPYNLTSKLDNQGHEIAFWSYDSEDRVTSHIWRDGPGLTVSYDSFSQRTVTDTYGRTATYNTSVINGLELVVGTGGCTQCGQGVIHWDYDPMGRVKGKEYANGRVDQFEQIDERGHPGKVILAAGAQAERTIYYTWHPRLNTWLSRTESSVLADGEKVTIRDYDDDGNDIPNEAPTLLLHKVIEKGYTRDSSGQIVPYDYITTYMYDEVGQVVSIDGPLLGTDDAITFSYNNSGDLIEINRALVGSTIFTDYDGAGQVGRIIDPNGYSVRFSYDGRGRIIEQGDRIYTYGPWGELDSITDEDGITLSLGYDGTSGRLSRIYNSTGDYIAYSYDGSGNKTEEAIYTQAGQKAYWKGYSYQGPTYPGRLYREIKPDGSYTEYQYDDMGNITEIEDPEGNVTQYEYDLFNRVTKVMEPGEVVTTYSYDRRGNLISVTDPEGHTTTYEYDDMGRVVKRVNPDTRQTTYAYNSIGKVTSKTDARGTTTIYSYDGLGRLIHIDTGATAQNITYMYDEGQNAKTRLTKIEDEAGEVRYKYDLRGRLVEEKREIGQREYTISYQYSEAGRLESIVYPGGLRVIYHRDVNGDVDKIEATVRDNTITIATNIDHMPFGPIRGLNFGNDFQLYKGFDEGYQVTEIRTGDLFDLLYSYDHRGQITQIRDLVDPGTDRSFFYDGLGRLVGATGRFGNIGYTYDKVGNRLSRESNGEIETYTYEQGTNRLAGITGTTQRLFSYDEGGNTVALGEFELRYNCHGRMVEVLRGGERVADYVYDGLGRRVVKDLEDKRVLYFYDPTGKVLGEREEGGVFEKDYIYVDGVLIAKVVYPDGGIASYDQDEDGDVDGMDLARAAQRGGIDLEALGRGFGRDGLVTKIYYYHTDHLGTPMKITDEQGQVVWEGEYLPFGKLISSSGDMDNNIRFPGQYYDEETGFHYNYFRYYDPEIGRYLRPDPILGHREIGIGVRLKSFSFSNRARQVSSYCYTEGNPIVSVDPRGLAAVGGGAYYLGGAEVSIGSTKCCDDGSLYKVIVLTVCGGVGIGLSGMIPVDLTGFCVSSRAGCPQTRYYFKHESVFLYRSLNVQGDRSGVSANLGAGIYGISTSWVFCSDTVIYRKRLGCCENYK